MYDGSGHPQNGCQGRASAGFAGRRSLTAGFSLHPLHVRSPKGDFLRGVVTRKEPETQASSDMERVRMRVYTVLYTRKTAVKDAAGAAQRAKILDGRIFPSPAPRKVPERGLFTWSGSRGKNPRRKLPLTWRGFGSGCILCSTPAKRLSRTRQRRLCRSEILDGRIFPSTAPHSKKKMAFLPSFFTAN